MTIFIIQIWYADGSYGMIPNITGFWYDKRRVSYSTEATDSNSRISDPEIELNDVSKITVSSVGYNGVLNLVWKYQN